MKMALLNAQDVFIRMDEAETPTERHLPQITECDLPPGKYQWISDPDNPMGGAFWPVAWVERVKQDRFDVIKSKQAAQVLAQRRAQRKAEREQREQEQQGGS